MNQIYEWRTAPKEGLIMVQFPDGTKSEAQWNIKENRWEVPYEGTWRAMNYAHGTNLPVIWWKIVPKT